MRLVHFCNTVSPVLLRLVPPNLDAVLTRLQGTSTAIYGTLYLVENFAEMFNYSTSYSASEPSDEWTSLLVAPQTSEIPS